MGRIGVVETASSFSQPQKQASHGEASKLALGSTALSLASLMLLTDSAEAQQSSGPLPTIQVNPPQRAKQKQATSAARRAAGSRAGACSAGRANPVRSDRTRHRLSGRPARRLAHPDAADRHAANHQRRHAAGNPRSQYRHRWKTRCAAFPASRSTPAKADSRATPNHPRLRLARRHLPRRHPRSGLVHARSVLCGAGRGLQRARPPSRSGAAQPAAPSNWSRSSRPARPILRPC